MVATGLPASWLLATNRAQRAVLRRRERDLAWLGDMSQRLRHADTLAAVLDEVYDGIRDGLGYDRVGIDLINRSAGVVEERIATNRHGRKTTPTPGVVSLSAEGTLWRLPGTAAILGGAPFYFTADARTAYTSDVRDLFDEAPRHHLIVPLWRARRSAGGSGSTIYSADAP